MKKVFPVTICLLILSTSIHARLVGPLANAYKSGLYAKSIEQVLRLGENDVDLATATLIVSEQWSDMVYGRRYLARLDNMALEIRDRLKRQKLKVDQSAIPVINDYLFKELEYQSISEASNPNSLFLHTVMDTKRGYCLSLSILYLSIAERLGLPMYGVVVPGHFFVRYDDGRQKINIETTSNGGRATDEHYITKFKVPKGNNHIYMKNLSKIQTLGCFFNNLGNSYSDIGDIESALLAFERAVTINPTLSESRANLGNIYLKKGLVAKAIREYQAALDINPHDPRMHYNLGNAYTQRESFNYAVYEYMRSIDLDPEYVDAYKNLAAVYAKQKRYGQAISKLKIALNMKPQDAGCFSQLGDIYVQMEDYERAVDQFKKALKIKPDLVGGHFGLATCYNKLGLVDEEIWEYKMVLTTQPDMVYALINLGNAYYTKGRYALAAEQYEKAVRVKPDEAMAYYNLGTVYSEMKQFDKAVTSYLEAVELDPEIGDAHYGLAIGCYQVKKFDLAWKHIKIAQQLGVKVPDDQLKAIQSRLK
jgi:tetratricopeptide (TPR) repeat protein